MSWVFDHSQAVGNDRVVLLVLADVANEDHGHRAWYSISTVARKAHISERTAQRSLKALCELGELVEESPTMEDIAAFRPDRRPRVYRMTFAARGDNLTPGESDERGDNPGATGCQNASDGVTDRAPRGDTVVTQYQKNARRTQVRAKRLPSEAPLTPECFAEFVADSGWPESFIEHEWRKFCVWAEAKDERYADTEAGFALWLSRSKGPKAVAR